LSPRASFLPAEFSRKSAVVDYYSILKVKRTASAAEIKSAYRKLARERHPDVNGGTEKAAREFALISLAYRTLSDPQERAYYDNQLQRVHTHERLRRRLGLQHGQPARAAPAPYDTSGALRPAR
jgi:DnaJ-class molecular chaperone